MTTREDEQIIAAALIETEPLLQQQAIHRAEYERLSAAACAEGEKQWRVREERTALLTERIKPVIERLDLSKEAFLRWLDECAIHRAFKGYVSIDDNPFAAFISDLLPSPLFAGTWVTEIRVYLDPVGRDYIAVGEPAWMTAVEQSGDWDFAELTVTEVRRLVGKSTVSL